MPRPVDPRPHQPSPEGLDPVPPVAQSVNAESLAQLADMIPEAFRDGVIDPDALLAHLGLVPAKADKEAPYAFTWSGLTRARTEATAPTTATLRADPGASVDWGDTGHVVIEGDNLQVLKLLLNSYRGRFKLIYIDPPYNTGSTFTYSDKYSMPEAEWLRQTGQVDEEGNALTSRIENGGRKHAPWLTMMLPRLIVARHLLSRDGAIVAAIDDNEIHHLRMLMDAVFGEVNLIGSFVWEGGRKNDARFMSVGHDYMLVYARDKAHLVSRDIRWNVRKRGLEEIYAQVETLRAEFGDDFSSITAGLNKWYDSLKPNHPSLTNRHYRKVDARGIYYPDNLRSPNPRPNLRYDYKGFRPHKNGWAVELAVMERLDAEDRLVLPEDPDGRIAVKRYLHEHETQALASVVYKDRRASAKALTTLMGAEVFDFPKDTTILAQLLEAMTDGGDLVLDFFAGTGSTGHAVWQQNAADGGSRRFVLVQAPEETTEDDPAREAGYDTISELMLERLRRASVTIANGDVGFRVFRLAESNLREDPPITTDGSLDGTNYIQQALAIHATPTILEGSDPQDVLWEVLLKGTRFDLSSLVEERNDQTPRYVEVQRRGEISGVRTIVCLASQVTLSDLENLKLTAADTLICVKDAMDDSTAITMGQRCKLLVIERVRHEVSL